MSVPVSHPAFFQLTRCWWLPADRKYGWAPMGMPCVIKQELKRSKRWSILPAYTVDGYIAYEVHQGSITADIFNDFVQHKVLPLCNSSGPRSVLVMDNARIHWSAELEAMCSEAGVLLARLPPYSPDFNPIETSFSILKQWMRRNYRLAISYTEETGGFRRFLLDAVEFAGDTGKPGNLFKQAGIDYQQEA